MGKAFYPEVSAYYSQIFSDNNFKDYQHKILSKREFRMIKLTQRVNYEFYLLIGFVRFIYGGLRKYFIK
jgi:hypothetical protein